MAPEIDFILPQRTEPVLVITKSGLIGHAVGAHHGNDHNPSGPLCGTEWAVWGGVMRPKTATAPSVPSVSPNVELKNSWDHGKSLYSMHPKNPYNSKTPNFAQLASRYPDFKPYVTISDEDGYASIDFKDPAALRALTKALLKEDWDYHVDLPEDRLCPTIANRLDYLLQLLDFLPHIRPAGSKGETLRVVDVGTGAIAIYPLLLRRLYPAAEILATELDDISLEHAKSTLQANNIPESSISIHRPPDSRILFPLYPDFKPAHSSAENPPEDVIFDYTICNPPFFSSQAELEAGKELKAEAPHAGATAAANELITDGGEVGFVGKMIEESMDLNSRCRWYTSLIGKYSSLQSLIKILQRYNIDNYFIKSIKQAKTARWILGWSHGSLRLPDELTRPHNLIPGTSFARILPLPNTFTYNLDHGVDVEKLRDSIQEILEGVSLVGKTRDQEEEEEEAANEGSGSSSSSWILEPRRNTWSRSARRLAARGEAGANEGGGQSLFRARLQIRSGDQSSREIPATASSSPQDIAGSEQQAHNTNESASPKVGEGTAQPASTTNLSKATLSLDWIEGRDRTLVDGLWRYILDKSGLRNKRPREEVEEDSRQSLRNHDDPEEGENKGLSTRQYPTGHWRGGSGGFRAKWAKSRGDRGRNL